MEETWLDIKNYEGLYQVSDLGRVKNLKFNRIVKLYTQKTGYIYVCLCKDGKKTSFRVHRLVAETFIPNPDNLPCVNHKDENKENNIPENLEWCDMKYNTNYGTRNIRLSNTKKVSILQIDKNTDEVIREWTSAIELIPIFGKSCPPCICACCKGRQKTAYGFKWSYASEP